MDTGALCLPPAPRLKEPLLGLTVTPLEAVAVQLMVCAEVHVDWAPMDADPESPGFTII
jgi:hypothetical protein